MSLDAAGSGSQGRDGQATSDSLNLVQGILGSLDCKTNKQMVGQVISI